MMQCGSSAIGSGGTGGELVVDGSMPGEMEGASIGIDEATTSQEDEGDAAVTCDLCGICFLSLSDLLEHHKKEHMNEAEAEQAQMLRTKPSCIPSPPASQSVLPAAAAAAAAPLPLTSSPHNAAGPSGSGQDDALARLQSRLGLSITPVAGPSGGGNAESSTRSSGASALSLKPPGQRSGTIFKCRYCAYSTRVKQEYQKHEYIHKPLSCELCPYKTVWKNDLNKHMTKYHDTPPTDQESNQTSAPPLDQNQEKSSLTTSLLPSGGMLRNLLSTHPDTATQSSGTPNESLLYKTIQKVTESTQQSQQENVDREKFAVQQDLQNSVQKTPNNAHYFCPYCDFLTKTASRFHIHYMQHLNVRPFECSACNLKSNYYWDINKHIRGRISKGDRLHRAARCICINEAGLRDYSKYQCFIKEGPANGEHMETPDDQAEAGVMATQGRIHPSFMGDPTVQARIQQYQQQQRLVTPQNRSVQQLHTSPQQQQQRQQQQQQSPVSSQINARQVVQAQLAPVPVGSMIAAQSVAAIQQAMRQQQQARTNKQREDTHNYMIQQLQKKEQIRQQQQQQQQQQQTLQQQQQKQLQLQQQLQQQSQRSATISPATSEAPTTNGPPGGALKCAHCEYTCDHKDIMLGHLGAHANVLPFICTKCGLANKWHHTAWIHLQQVHRDTPVDPKYIRLQLTYRQNGNVFQMDETSQIVNRVEKVTSNAELTGVTRKLRCNNCPYRTVQKSNLQRHREGHIRARPDLMRYKCPYCDFYQETRRRIQRHMCLHPQHVKRGAQGVLDTNGVGLDITTTSLAAIFSDVTAERRREAGTVEAVNSTRDAGAEANGLVLKCDTCPFVTNSNSQFIYHKQFHRYNPKAKYKCDKCSYWAMHPHLITQHARVHQKGAPDQKFPEGSWLPPAEISVTTESNSTDSIRTFRVVKNGIALKMHKCRFCPLMNRSKDNVRFHELLHRETSPERYTCHLCTFKAQIQTELCNHLRSHVTQRVRKDDAGVEMIEEIEDTSDEESSAKAVQASSKTAAGSAMSRPQPVKKIKYNCSAVESELFNLLQSRQNGGSSMHSNDFAGPLFPKQEVIKKPKEAPTHQKQKDDIGERRRDGLISYQNKKNQRKWVACPECPALFVSPNELKRHLSHHRHPDEFRCSKCSYSMNKPVYIQQHEQVHTEEYMIKKLGFCHRHATGPGTRKQALKLGMPPRPSKPIFLVPKKQPATSTDVPSTSTVDSSKPITSLFPSVPKDERRVSSGKETVTPSKERKAAASKEQTVKSEISADEDSENSSTNYASEEYSVALLMAELQESKAVFDGVTNGRYKCSACPASFDKQVVLRFHARLHDELMRRFKCHVCSYSVDEKDNMAAHAQLHYMRHHLSTPAVKQCPKCPATFSKQNLFESHLLRHVSEGRFRCEQCHFATNKYDIISRHRGMHDAAVSKTDSGLDLDANSQQSISVLFHTASVPQTLVEDAEPMTLEAVTRTPEPEELEEERRMFSCTACPHTCVRKDGMQHHIKRHILKHENGCPHCSYSNINPATLRDHVKTHFTIPKTNRAQAFLHYDDLKIKFEDGEILFEDRGRHDATRFYPDSIPELLGESPDLLVEFIESDVFAVVNQVLDKVCADRRRMEREVSNSTIYGAIVRRSASLRTSQDDGSALKRPKPTRSSMSFSDPSKESSVVPQKIDIHKAHDGNKDEYDSGESMSPNVNNNNVENEKFNEVKCNGILNKSEFCDTLNLVHDQVENSADLDECIGTRRYHNGIDDDGTVTISRNGRATSKEKRHSQEEVLAVLNQIVDSVSQPTPHT